MIFAQRTLLTATLSLVILAGCSRTSESQQSAATGAASSEAKTAAGAADTKAARRIVTVGGPITETAFALGAGADVVGVDSSSTFPAEAHTRKQVGYQRALSAEGVLSLQPTLILAASEAGPPPALEQIKGSGVALKIIAGEHSVEGAKAKVRGVAEALGVPEAAKKLTDAIDADAAKATKLLEKAKDKPKVLALFARGPGVVLVSGDNSAADAMIKLAGATNAATGVEGSKPLTSEAAVAAAPDVLLIPSHALESIGGVDGLLKLPGIAETPAGKAKRVVSIDDLLLLGFGPRTGEALLKLVGELHPELRDGAAQ